jgi:hypothetical protein
MGAVVPSGTRDFHFVSRVCSVKYARADCNSSGLSSGGQHALGHGSVGHHGGGVGDSGSDSVQVADAFVIPFPEKVPDGGLGRHYVGLIAAMRDHIMGALLGAQMLAAKVPAGIHQLDCVESAAAFPRRAGGMRALSMEAVLGGDQARSAGSVGGGEIAGDMAAQHDVQIAEQSGQHHVGPAGQQLLGDSRINTDGSRYLVFRHHLLQHERGGDIQRLAGVVAFAMAWPTLDERGMESDTRLLRGLRQAVDIGHESDHGLARSPACDERRGHARHTPGDREAVLLQNAGDVGRRAGASARKGKSKEKRVAQRRKERKGKQGNSSFASFASLRDNILNFVFLFISQSPDKFPKLVERWPSNCTSRHESVPLR